ncbi:hypothetical protein JTB14_014136 [Gonioctena quinquepunctata]|nr:hypothetical protein JTB14_014136 [Gonioctena quinquepunctata]
MIFASQLKGRNPTQMEIAVAVRDGKKLKGRSIPQIKMWLQNQSLRKKMDNLDISKMTSDEAFALLDEEASDQEGVTDQQAIDSDIGGDSDAEDNLPYESLAST